MLKNIILYFSILFFFQNLSLNAQSLSNGKKVYETIAAKKTKNIRYKRFNIFDSEVVSAKNNYADAVSDGVILSLNQDEVNRLLSVNPENLKLEIPLSNDGETVILELFKADVFTSDVTVRTSDGRVLTGDIDLGKHYRGVVSGDVSSLVSISVFAGEILGFVSDSSGTYTLGKLQNSSNQHIFYKSQDLLQQPFMDCETADDGKSYKTEDLSYEKGISSSTGNCVNVYVESGSSVYDGFGGDLTNTTTFLSGLFAQSYVLYANEGIIMQTSELFIWTTTDPYNSSDSSTQLSGFQNNTSSINADIGHLVELQNIGGIAAGFDGICNSNVNESLCFSGLFNLSFNNVPTYSFNVYLITHEMGHLLGSRHTHACVWNGNNTAIDGCAGFTEGTCALPGSPVGGGTIMSYCSNDPVSVNFNEGFHPQPSAVINNTVNDVNNCLTNCAECISANVPTNIQASSITDTSAIISWDAQSGALYDLRYRESGTTTWTDLTNLLFANTTLTGLTELTEYEVQVRSKCPEDTPTAFSTSIFFTTLEFVLEYCDSASQNSLGIFHISNVNLNTIDNNSIESTYTDFTNISTTLEEGQTYTITITPTVDNLEYTTRYSVWIDYNLNGSFEDAGEQVFTFDGLAQDLASGQFTVPIGIDPVSTRMRVSLKNGEGIPTSCETFTFGEVEDYTINIAENPCTVFENFEAGLPTGWSTVVNTGDCDWVNQSETPTGDDFPTLAMVFDDDACGNGAPASNVSLLSDVYDTTGASSILLNYDVAFQEVGAGETLTVEVWDGMAWQQIAFYDTNLNPDIQSEADIDATAFANTDFQIRWTYDDAGAWGWHAGVDNFCMKLIFNTWEGTISTDWNTPGNWSNGVVPTSTDTAIIQDVPNQPLIDASTTGEANNLILDSNTVVSVEGVLKVSGNISNDGEMLYKSNANRTGQFDTFTGTYSGTGNVRTERFIPAEDNNKRAFRFLSSSVNSTESIRANWQEAASAWNDDPNPGFGTHITGVEPNLNTNANPDQSQDGLNGFDWQPSGNPSLFLYPNASQNWAPIANTDASTLTAGTAYRLMVRGNRNINLTLNAESPSNTKLRAMGNLVFGSIDMSADLAQGANEFSFVGNPYQAVVDFSKVIKINLRDYLYIWDASLTGENGRGAYVVVEVSSNGIVKAPTASSSTATKFIAPQQAFFVRNTSAGNPTLIFEETDKATTQAQVEVFSTYSNFYINARLYKTADLQNNQTELDAIALRFGENYTTLADEEDAEKLGNPNENFAIINQGLRAIDKQNIPADGHEVALFVNNYTDTDYSFTFDLENVPEGQTVWLQDQFLGTSTPINTGSVYAFTVDATIPASTAFSRFKLKFEMETFSNADFEENVIKIYPNPTEEQFYISGLTSVAEVHIYDVLGKEVLVKDQVSNQEGIHIESLPSGVYVVKVIQGEMSFSTKLVKN